MAEPTRTSLERYILSLNTSEPGQLTEWETLWRDRHDWLLEQGYQLRPRYSPNWKPSWEGTKESYVYCEDGLLPSHPAILDAVRKKDGAVVSLKRTSKSVHPDEVAIGQLFSSPPLSSDPGNHCVPINEVLQDPLEEDLLIIVMPLLRAFDEPRFDTVGEAVEFFRQVIEGMRFLHENHVAHRDCSPLNIMMEPKMYPALYHPIRTAEKRDLSGAAKHHSRTERPVKYYFIDFGLSKRYSAEDRNPLEMPIRGGDKSVPEFQGEGYNQPSDPFAVDVYCLGNLIRKEFTQRYSNLQFMDGLVADMVQDDPTKRPDMEQVSLCFADIQKQVSRWKLRAMLVRRDDERLFLFLKGVRHVFRTAGYIVRRLPPQPTPKS